VLNVLALDGGASANSTSRSSISASSAPARARRSDGRAEGDLELGPLDAVHRAHGARMVPFGGWDMPLHYELGTIDEHLACRQ
jgi:hypothetical protein